MKKASLKNIFLENRDITDFFEPHGLNDNQERVLDSLLLALNPKRANYMRIRYPGYRSMFKDLSHETMQKSIEKYFGLPGDEVMEKLQDLNFSKKKATPWLIRRMQEK